jgi:hypothetical protein
MTLEQIKTEAELFLSSMQDQIEPLQDTYLSSVGKYWQGYGTANPPPEDGSIENPDPNAAIAGLPSWSSFGASLPSSAPFAVRVDEEKWPDGTRAFVCVTYFGWDGGLWTGSNRFKGGAWEGLQWVYFKMG